VPAGGCGGGPAGCRRPPPATGVWAISQPRAPPVFA
jgi:hypothetical protein